mgnify:FL=1
MGIVNVAIDSLGGVLADQWKDIVTAGHFNEHVVVAPGVRKVGQNGRGGNYGSNDVLSNGSLIFVPENTAAFIFSQAGIEQVITEPGGFEYRDGEASVFDDRDREEQGVLKMVLGQAARRVGYAGMSPSQKRVAFVNLREIRGIKFGTRGPLAYNDLFYGTDLEVFAYGQLSLQVVDAERFVRNFLPANTYSYSLDDQSARSMLIAEFLASFIVATNALSSEVRISQLPSHVNEIRRTILDEDDNAGTWEDRFGIRLVQVAIENIEFSDDSRELIKSYAKKKLDVSAYEGISKQAADVAAQQMIAEGVRDNGFGDAGGMMFGMGLAGMLNPLNASAASAAGEGSSSGGAPRKGSAEDSVGAARSFENQVEAIKKFKELFDAGILTQEEFDAKKREILGL